MSRLWFKKKEKRKSNDTKTISETFCCWSSTTAWSFHMQVLTQRRAEQIPFKRLSPYLTHRLYLSNNTSAYIPISLSQYLGWDPKPTDKRTKASMATDAVPSLVQPRKSQNCMRTAFSERRGSGWVHAWMCSPSPVLLLPGSSLSHSRGTQRKHTPTHWHTCWHGPIEGKPAVFPLHLGGPAGETSFSPGLNMGT